MLFNIKTWKLKYKLLVICLLISIIPLLVLGISSYFLSEKAVYGQIEEKLMSKVNDYQLLLSENMEKAQFDTEAARTNARMIVKQQAQIILHLFRLAKNANMEEIKNIIASMTVGRTGYIFALDYEGRYVISKGRQRDGENILGSTDASGRYFIQDIIRKGKALTGENVDYDIYSWKNEGEEKAREKIAAIIHIPRLGWVLGVSAYFDDLIDDNLKQKEIERFKAKLKSVKIGENGYMYVMDGTGRVIMHPDKEGKSLADYDFAKNMIRKKTEGGYLRYNWEGNDKVIAFAYYEPFDWIITAGSNLSDFTHELSMIQLIIIFTMIISIAAGTFVSFVFAGWIYKNLNRTADSLSSSAQQISSASLQLSNSSQEIASGATEQASSIEETTSSMEELASMVRQNLQNAREASTIADRAATSSKTGFDQMEKMLDSMKEINKSSDQISKVIKIIDDIAFQTNILALNAAVEAARAGEAGMGFAVVADEVKNLANKSAEAAKETSGMIESSIKKTEEGLSIASRLAETFKEILGNIQKVSEMNKEVETASVQQDAGINQVNKAIVQFDEVVQANASAAEETASSAEELHSQVEMLNNIVRELLKLVNGKNGNIGTGKAQINVHEVRHVTAPRRTNAAATTAKAGTATLTAPKKKEIAPEKLIPFEEDEEFKDADALHNPKA